MEAEAHSKINSGLKLLSSHLKRIAHSGKDCIQLNEDSIDKIKSLKGLIKSQSQIDPDQINNKSNSEASALNSIKENVSTSKGLRELGTLREKIVFSSGNANADIMFIGEAPGREEEIQGLPFVGPSGQLLTKIIQAMGMKREDVYISNIVKFRPMIEGKSQGSSNRKPTINEMELSLPFIFEEINVVRPRIIIALGGTAMQGLLKINDTLSSARGNVYDVQGTKAIVTYHPSFLLRSKKANQDKRKLWKDMMLVMEILNIPITEKQRNYFK